MSALRALNKASSGTRVSNTRYIKVDELKNKSKKVKRGYCFSLQHITQRYKILKID